MAQRRIAVVFALGIAWLAACERQPRAPAVHERDDFGDSLDLRAAPTRIVSLNPTTTEILFAIGAGPRLVGRTHWDLFPDSARLVPDLGDGIRPNVEAVMAARPDLVVLYAAGANRDAARALRSSGTPTLSLRIDRIADFRRATRLLGLVTGDTARARTVIDSVDATLDRAASATRGLEKPSVFWQSFWSPLITIGDSIWLSELLDRAGGRNIFAGLPLPSPQVSMEEVLRRNPDVIVVLPSNRARLLADPAWQKVPAVRAGKVLLADTLLVGRPGVRMGEAALSLARLLHPGIP